MIWRWKKEDELNGGELRVARGGRAQILSAVVAALPDPVLLLDHNGIVITANAHALDILEFDPADHHISAAIRAPQILEAVDHVLAHNDAVRVDYEMHVPLPRHFE